MKKLAAIVTSLVLGSAGLASADAYAKPAFRPVPEYRPAPHRWQTLASNLQLFRGRAMLDVNTKARFSTLKLDASGAFYVEKILVIYGNGEKQTISVDKQIGRRAPAATIDLEGRTRQIDKLVVIGKGNARASLSVQAI